jgi:type I restriction enzyme M protein
MIAEGHVPQGKADRIFMGKIWNDGFSKLKGRRVTCSGSEIPELEQAYRNFAAGRTFSSRLATTVAGDQLLDGAEWSPQKWLPQPEEHAEDVQQGMAAASRAILQAVAKFPGIRESVIPDFGVGWKTLPTLPLSLRRPLSYFFDVRNGKSSGEKNYRAGETPYISSGDAANSVIGLKAPEAEELFDEGGITVTAFGTASVQPWPFLARGNGGSSVRVLIPRFAMTEADLLWFAAQINVQRWRFFYARMAIKGRISNLVVSSPPRSLALNTMRLPERVLAFSESIEEFSLAPSFVPVANPSN